MDNEASELAELFQRRSSGLAGAVRGVLGARADVQEILQECFLRVLTALEGGRQPHDLEAFVFVSTLNLARDERRRRDRRGDTLSLDEESMMADTREIGARNAANPAAALERGELRDLVRNQIARLEEHQREIFLMRVSGELSFEAIARSLEIPVGTAKSRMRTALEGLRARLGPKLGMIERLEPGEHDSE